MLFLNWWSWNVELHISNHSNIIIINKYSRRKVLSSRRREKGAWLCLFQLFLPPVFSLLLFVHQYKCWIIGRWRYVMTNDILIIEEAIFLCVVTCACIRWTVADMEICIGVAGAVVCSEIFLPFILPEEDNCPVKFWTNLCQFLLNWSRKCNLWERAELWWFLISFFVFC